MSHSDKRGYFNTIVNPNPVGSNPTITSRDMAEWLNAIVSKTPPHFITLRQTTYLSGERLATSLGALVSLVRFQYPRIEAGISSVGRAKYKIAQS